MSDSNKQKAPAWCQGIGESSQGWSLVTMPFNAFSRSFVSGHPESHAIRIRYYQHATHPGLGGVVRFGPHAEGPPGHAHGGAQAAVLDEMCGGIAWIEGHPVLAANLSLDFRRMVPLHQDLRLYAHILRVEDRKVFTEGAIWGSDGQCYAEAKGLFLRLDAASLQALGAHVPFP